MAWFAPERLPEVLVMAGGRACTTREVRAVDGAVVWPGPLPAHAVTRFTVGSSSEREQLLAFASGFANVRLASPVEVHPGSDSDVAVPTIRSGEDTSGSSARLTPPAAWDALRGAAAMAVWAVPAVPTWLDVLCDTLAVSATGAAAARAGAPWWEQAPWRPGQGASLWRSAVDVLQAVARRTSWRPLEVLDAIRAGAEPSAELDAWCVETRAILRDERTVDLHRAVRVPVGAALQLVLLRPDPDRFVTWKDDLPAMPPAVWWTGATLAGLVVGFRELDVRFKGTPEAQRRLALRIWRLGDTPWVPWPDLDDARPTWRRREGKFELWWNDDRWAERAEHTRGRWLAADFSREEVARAGLALAERHAPECVVRLVELSDLAVATQGAGEIVVQPGSLAVRGTVALALPHDVVLRTDLNVERFRRWLTCAGMTERLPEPPAPVLVSEMPPPVFVRAAPTPIPGLVVVEDFVSEDEERTLLATVDDLPWRDDLRRRVQHYGWRYDYRARAVGPADALGPLPPWADDLAERLVLAALVDERPDQVIVNEYVENQGISKHIDCEPCFRGPIVSLSLGESWTMTFHGPGGERVDLLLPRRSAVVMRDDARHRWAHEIRARKTDPSGPRRGRRVSLTFRRVNVGEPLAP